MNISILQWNIWVNEQPSNVLQLIQSLNPDVVCLQEVAQHSPRSGNIDVGEFLATQLQYQYHYAIAHQWLDQTPPRTQGNCILSRFPLAQPRQVMIRQPQQGHGSYSTEGRVVCLAEVMADAQPLTVATTHLSYTDRFEPTDQKQQECEAFLQVIKPYQKRFIVTGDFNVLETADLIQQLSDQYQHASPPFAQKTWTTKPFSYHGFETDSLSWRLDYVFASRDIRVLSTQIVATPFSDHLPILTEIELSTS